MCSSYVCVMRKTESSELYTKVRGKMFYKKMVNIVKLISRKLKKDVLSHYSFQVIKVMKNKLNRSITPTTGKTITVFLFDFESFLPRSFPYKNPFVKTLTFAHYFSHQHHFHKHKQLNKI